MKTYSGAGAGSQIRPLLDNARESIWVVSPYLGKEYAELLAAASQKGVEVRIITSKADYNLSALEILKACEHSELHFLVLDRDSSDDKATFIHAKIYLVDQKFGISGSANLTYSGLNANVESLNIAENEAEVQQIERDFMRLWLKYEKKSITKEELSAGTTFSIEKALPPPNTVEFINEQYITGKELVYYPYYFFEFIFRGSVRSPPLLFEDKGIIVLDGVTRQIVNDNLLASEVNNKPITDYVLNTEGKYNLKVVPPKITQYREAKELVLDYIINKNTRTYTQYYGSRGYDRLFVPRRYEVSFINSKFVRVPIWYLETQEPQLPISDGLRHQRTILASSGKVWNDFSYCPICQMKILSTEMTRCETCGNVICQNCVQTTGLIFKKKLCPPCYHNKR